MPFDNKDNYMYCLKKYQEIAHHSEEIIYYLKRQEDILDSFPMEHFQILRASESAFFIPPGYPLGS